MNPFRIFLWAVPVLVVVGCRGPACPAGYALDDAGGCSPVDGGFGGDAGLREDTGSTLDAAPGDVSISDVGIMEDGAADAEVSCVATAETCNGLDDDCDGRADESLATVGSASVVSAGDFRSPQIVALPGGFGVVYVVSAPRALAWVAADSSGVPVGAPIGLGSDTSSALVGLSASFDGTNVITAFSTGTDYRVFAFAPESGGRAWGPFTLPEPAGGSHDYRVTITDTSAGRLTVYAGYDVGTYYSVWRYRLNTSGAIPVVIHETEVSTELASANAWSAIDAGSTDLLVFRSATDDILLVSGESGDDTTGFGTPLIVRTALEAPDVTDLGIAVRTAAAPISVSNPIGIAWHRLAGGGAGFVHVTALTSSGVGTSASLPGSEGAFDWGGHGARTLDIVAAPGSASSSGGHWYVVAMDDDPASTTLGQGMLRAWEVIGDAEITRTLTVPAAVPAPQFEISLATVGTAVVIAEENEAHSIVTREIGCP